MPEDGADAGPVGLADHPRIPPQLRVLLVGLEVAEERPHLVGAETILENQEPVALEAGELLRGEGATVPVAVDHVLAAGNGVGSLW